MSRLCQSPFLPKHSLIKWKCKVNKVMRILTVLLFVWGFSAFGGSKDYTSVFKKTSNQNTILNLQNNLMRDIKNLYNILRKDNKVLVVFKPTSKKPPIKNIN